MFANPGEATAGAGARCVGGGDIMDCASVDVRTRFAAASERSVRDLAGALRLVLPWLSGVRYAFDDADDEDKSGVLGFAFRRRLDCSGALTIFAAGRVFAGRPTFLGGGLLLGAGED